MENLITIDSREKTSNDFSLQIVHINNRVIVYGKYANAYSNKKNVYTLPIRIKNHCCVANSFHTESPELIMTVHCDYHSHDSNLEITPVSSGGTRKTSGYFMIFGEKV